MSSYQQFRQQRQQQFRQQHLRQQQFGQQQFRQHQPVFQAAQSAFEQQSSTLTPAEQRVGPPTEPNVAAAPYDPPQADSEDSSESSSCDDAKSSSQEPGAIQQMATQEHECVADGPTIDDEDGDDLLDTPVAPRELEVVADEPAIIDGKAEDTCCETAEADVCMPDKAVDEEMLAMPDTPTAPQEKHALVVEEGQLEAADDEDEDADQDVIVEHAPEKIIDDVLDDTTEDPVESDFLEEEPESSSGTAKAFSIFGSVSAWLQAGLESVSGRCVPAVTRLVDNLVMASKERASVFNTKLQATGKSFKAEFDSRVEAVRARVEPAIELVVAKMHANFEAVKEKIIVITEPIFAKLQVTFEAIRAKVIVVTEPTVSKLQAIAETGKEKTIALVEPITVTLKEKSAQVTEKCTQLAENCSQLLVPYLAVAKDSLTKYSEIADTYRLAAEDRLSSTREMAKVRCVAAKDACCEKVRSAGLGAAEMTGVAKEQLVNFSQLAKTRSLEARDLCSEKLYAAGQGAAELSKERSVQVAAASAAGGAIVVGTGGAATGLAAGSAIGGALGLVPAVVTFGASIPVFAAVGGVCGMVVGTVCGGTAGLLGGGVLGYGTYTKRDTIGNCVATANNAAKTGLNCCSDSVSSVSRRFGAGLELLSERLTVSKNLVGQRVTVAKNLVSERLTVGKELVTERLTVGKEFVTERLTIGKEVVSDRLAAGKEMAAALSLKLQSNLKVIKAEAQSKFAEAQTKCLAATSYLKKENRQMLLESCSEKIRNVSQGAGEMAKDRGVQVTAVSAAGGAIVVGTGGAATGLAAGSALGAAVGLVPAIFTFGLSIPVFATIGAACGTAVGTVCGGAVGLVGGGAVGYGAYSKFDTIGSGVATAKDTIGSGVATATNTAKAQIDHCAKYVNVRLVGA